MSGRLIGRTSEFESEDIGSTPVPTTHTLLAQSAEATVLETEKCGFESRGGYKGEITEQGSGVLAKRSVRPWRMGVGNSFLRLRSSKQPLADVLLWVAKMKNGR